MHQVLIIPGEPTLMLQLLDDCIVYIINGYKEAQVQMNGENQVDGKVRALHVDKKCDHEFCPYRL
jgi:hypothetical protein